MKALRFHKFGSPSVLAIEEVPRPEPHGGEVLDFYHNLSRLAGVDTMKLTPRDVGAIAQNLCSGFEAGALKPPAIESVPFENAIQAYERLVTGETNAKQVLTFSTNQTY